VTPICDRPLPAWLLLDANPGLRPSNRNEKPAFESRRDPLLDLCGDALIDASVDGSLVGDRPQRETFQLPPQLPRSREIASIPQNGLRSTVIVG